MVCFRAGSVVNHGTLVYGVVLPEIEPALEDGGNMSFLKRVLKSGTPLLGTMAMVYYPSKGVLEFLTPLLRKGTASLKRDKKPEKH